eukprot:360268-Rhodomonas_salina.1
MSAPPEPGIGPCPTVHREVDASARVLHPAAAPVHLLLWPRHHSFLKEHPGHGSNPLTARQQLCDSWT